MLSEPTLLMILPGCLVLVGMITGFVMWSWARGVDSQVIDDIHDDIRRLSNRFKDSEEHPVLIDLQIENDELRAECASLTQRHFATVQELQEVKALVQIFESESVLAEQTITQLNAELGAVRETSNIVEDQQEASRETYEFIAPTIYSPDLQIVEDSTADPEPELSNSLRSIFPEPAQTTLDVEYGGQVRFDENLGLVYSRPPMMNDNLQLISGIASKLEQQLNDFGVHTFQQIMLWNQHNIDEFSQLLDTFQDRIQRDDWVGQARALYEKARQMRKAA